MSQKNQVIRIPPLVVQYIQGVYFANANVPVTIEHQLGIPPIHFTAKVDKAARIYEGQVPPASNAIQLVSDTANVRATIRVEAVQLSER